MMIKKQVRLTKPTSRFVIPDCRPLRSRCLTPRGYTVEGAGGQKKRNPLCVQGED